MLFQVSRLVKYVMKYRAMTESRGYLYAFLCSILSALMIVLIKWVQVELPTLSVLFLALSAAALVLTVLIAFHGGLGTLKRQSRRGWAWLAGVSALTFFAYWTLFKAVDLLDPTVASFLGRTETLVTILFGMVFLGERLSRRELGGGALVIAGVVVIRYVGGMEVSRGFLICLAAALCWGLSEGMAKIAVRHMEPLVITWGRCLFLAPVFFLTASASPEGLVLPSSAPLWAGVLSIALVGPVLGRYSYMKALSLIPVSKAALINQLQPVWVAVMACLLLKTLPSVREFAGGLMIIAGCMILVRRR